jgi:hypothetical protein
MLILAPQQGTSDKSCTESEQNGFQWIGSNVLLSFFLKIVSAVLCLLENGLRLHFNVRRPSVGSISDFFGGRLRRTFKRLSDLLGHFFEAVRHRMRFLIWEYCFGGHRAGDVARVDQMHGFGRKILSSFCGRRVCEKLFGSEGDSRLGEVVRGKLYGDCVAWDNPDEVLAHFSGHVGKNGAPCGEFNAKHGAWKHFGNGSFCFD